MVCQADNMNVTNSDARAKRTKTLREGARQAAISRRARIQFLIRLSATDPGALDNPERPGDRLNLVAALYHHGFIHAKGSDLRAEIQRHTEELRAKDGLLQPLVDATRKLLAAAADKRRFEWNLLPGSKFIFDGARSPESFGRGLHYTPPGQHDVEQVLILGGIALLAGEEGAMVRRCARNQCERIFLANRPKQIFCQRS